MKRIYYRKTLVFLVLMTVLTIVSISGCKKMDNAVEVISNDMTKPGVVSEVKVENLNGAARITYRLPDSKNLLYVLASYPINDNRIRETKSSYYTDTIFVDGFARSQDYEVTLYAVSRANVKSDPVTVKVRPTTPNYLLTNAGLNITPDFGGANFFGVNPNKAPLAMHMLVYNESTKRLDEQEPIYLSTDTIDVSIRNLPPTPHRVGIFTTDRFGNASDTVFKTITPLFETLLDKSKFFVYKLPSDAPTDQYGWDFRYFFDGRTDGTGWHTNTNVTRSIGTFGMGKSAKLSRLVVWQRAPSYYSFQNTRQFTLWGTNKDNPTDAQMPQTSSPGTVVGDWTNLGNFTFPNPPSGLPASQANAADMAFVAQGVNFTMPRLAPEVKYIRFHVTQTWGGLNYVNAMEISIYGSPL
jgi:hypothetical protein